MNTNHNRRSKFPAAALLCSLLDHGSFSVGEIPGASNASSRPLPCQGELRGSSRRDTVAATGNLTSLSEVPSWHRTPSSAPNDTLILRGRVWEATY